MKKRQGPKGVVITTSRGVTIECLPIAADLEALEENIRGSIEWPDIPTRTIKDVAGSEITEQLSQEYVDSGYATDEEKGAWADYLEANNKAEAEFRKRRGEGQPRLIAYRGIRVLSGGVPEDEWVADCKWMRMTVPDDPRERSLLYFRTAIMGNVVDDLAAIMVGIYKASGYDEEVLSQVEANFRLKVGRPGARPETDDGQENLGQSQEQNGLVGQPDLDDSGDGQPVGADV